MYFEERMIDGVMCHRTNPKYDFQPYTLQELSRRYDHLLKNILNRK